jgi:hypothetical protein
MQFRIVDFGFRLEYSVNELFQNTTFQVFKFYLNLNGKTEIHNPKSEIVFREGYSTTL